MRLFCFFQDAIANCDFAKKSPSRLLLMFSYKSCHNHNDQYHRLRSSFVEETFQDDDNSVGYHLTQLKTNLKAKYLTISLAPTVVGGLSSKSEVSGSSLVQWGWYTKFLQVRLIYLSRIQLFRFFFFVLVKVWNTSISSAWFCCLWN